MGELKVDIDVQLYPHQETSIIEMETREKEKCAKIDDDTYVDTTMGIFGDIPGYGKSLSMIGVIVRDKMEWDISTPFIYEETIERGPTSTYTTKIKIRKHKLDCNLIVASTSIIAQWEKELDRTTLGYYTITKKNQIEDIDPDDYHIVICSSTMYNDLVAKFEEYAWKRFIFDEAASTHIPSMKSIHAGFYWFITATFPALNKVRGVNHFIKNTFNRMSPNVFGALLVKNDDNYVKQSFSIPRPVEVIHLCTNSAILDAVQGLVSNTIRQMLSAGDITGAIQTLGGTKSDKNIVDLVTKKTQDELIDAEFKVDKYKKEKDKNKASRERYDNWVKKVDNLKKKIQTLKDRFEKILDEPCCICQDDMKRPILVSCCQNIFCSSCILEWLKDKHTCPLCRTAVNRHELVLLKGKGDTDEKKVVNRINKSNGKTKQEKIIDIIKSKERGKFLIFSNYDESFKIIKAVMDENNINFVEIKGGRSSRENKLSLYKEGGCNVLLLNSKYNGAGINLQNTTDIILFHEMDEHIEKQVIGRANRIGRKEVLTLHRLEYE